MAFVSGCGPYAKDVANEVRGIPVQRLVQLEQQGRALVQREDIRRRLESGDFMVEWSAFQELPEEFSDLAPIRVWLTKREVNLCFYRAGDHSVNLDIAWPEGESSSAVLSWGDYRAETIETLWRAEQPNKSVQPTPTSGPQVDSTSTRRRG